MFDNQERILIPITCELFSIAQFSREKKLNEKYAGNLILFPNGQVKIIKKIDFKDFYGKTFLMKLFSVLNATYDISVSFDDISPHIGELIEMVDTYLKKDLSSSEPYMPAQRIDYFVDATITNSTELYSALDLPSADDCLDVMV